MRPGRYLDEQASLLSSRIEEHIPQTVNIKVQAAVSTSLLSTLLTRHGVCFAQRISQLEQQNFDMKMRINFLEQQLCRNGLAHVTKSPTGKSVRLLAT